MSLKHKTKKQYKKWITARLKCDLSLPMTGIHKDINKQPGKQELLLTES